MKSNFILIAVIVCGFPLVFGLNRFLEAEQKPLPQKIAEADLAFRAETLKKHSFGFDGLIADYYWISSLQYIGRKIVAADGLQNIQIDNLKPLNPRLLYPMLDTVTTLDPNFTNAYAYGAIVLPAIDAGQAIKLTEKGIKAQPNNWRLYHYLGFIYWKKKDYQKASEIYGKGAAIKGAPKWMRQMQINMQADGSSRATARALYKELLANADDEQSKTLAQNRLWQIDSLEEREVLDAALQDFQKQNNRCPANWSEIFPFLQRGAKLPDNRRFRFLTDTLAPLDPSNAPYRLTYEEGVCRAKLDAEKSKIPLVSP
jgi:tetratricopeptide (TPR) repeat protein